jgi:nucleotide-binding universal stress UspA family protein
MEWMTGETQCARHVCCAVRFDENDEAVLRRAREVAGELDAELSIVHAVSYNNPLSRPREHELQLARSCVDRLREKFAPEASLHVEVGDVSTVVSRALYRLDAGLLVAGGQGEAIIAAEMACPVLRVAAASAHAIGRTA